MKAETACKTGFTLTELLCRCTRQCCCMWACSYRSFAQLLFPYMLLL